jgi:hypothetical protein
MTADGGPQTAAREVIFFGGQPSAVGGHNKYNFFVKNYKIDKRNRLLYNQASL